MKKSSKTFSPYSLLIVLIVIGPSRSPRQATMSSSETGAGGSLGLFRKKSSDKTTDRKKNGEVVGNHGGSGEPDTAVATAAAAATATGPPAPPEHPGESIKAVLSNSHSCQEISTKRALHLRKEDNPNLLLYLRIENIVERMQKDNSGEC